MVLGITGPFASGKSAATEFFRSRGFRVVDVDSIGHLVLEKSSVRRALRGLFGSGVFLPDGRVDRRLLGSLVFRDSRLLKKLNRIVHPLMRAEVRRQIGGGGTKKTVIDAALLFEMGLDRLCDRILLVTAPLKSIVERGMKRNRFDPGRIKAILNSQQSLASKRKRADLVIRNDSTLAAFRLKIAKAYGRLAGAKAAGSR